MGLTDPIGDGLTKIQNASRARHVTVEVRPSRLLAEILDVLQREGFIRTYKPIGESPADRRLRIYLKYAKNTPVLNKMIRVSKPGCRWYRGAQELPRVLGGLGVAVISTSRGLMTDRDAFRQRIGGEVICYVS